MFQINFQIYSILYKIFFRNIIPNSLQSIYDNIKWVRLDQCGYKYTQYTTPKIGITPI